VFPDFSSAAARRAVGFQRRYCPRQVVQGRGDLPGAAAVGTRNRLLFIFHLGPSVLQHDDFIDAVCNQRKWRWPRAPSVQPLRLTSCLLHAVDCEVAKA
jgi:hypothetical protein